MKVKKSQKSIDLETLRTNLQQLHEQLRHETKRKWKRILPFDELLFDRWEKASFLKTKKDASLYHNSYIFGNVSIGKKTWIGPFTILDGSGGRVKIGDYCSISSGVQIYTHHTAQWSLTGGKSPYEKGPVLIGDFCYLGPYVVVSKGVRIGKCSLVGAHSLVNSNFPPYSIVFGVPAKRFGTLKVKGKKVVYHYFDKSKKLKF